MKRQLRYSWWLALVSCIVLIVSCQLFDNKDKKRRTSPTEPETSEPVAEIQLLDFTADTYPAGGDAVAVYIEPGRLDVFVPVAGDYLLTITTAQGQLHIVFRAQAGTLLSFTLPADEIVQEAVLSQGMIRNPNTEGDAPVETTAYAWPDIWPDDTTAILFAWPVGGGIGAWDQIFVQGPEHPVLMLIKNGEIQVNQLSISTTPIRQEDKSCPTGKSCCGDYESDGDNPYPCCKNNANCTWWAWKQAHEVGHVKLPRLGNGAMWGDARNWGYCLSHIPAVGTVAVDNLVTDNNPYGHVGWVEGVSGETIQLNEMKCSTVNENYDGGPSIVSENISRFTNNTNEGFIYLRCPDRPVIAGVRKEGDEEWVSRLRITEGEKFQIGAFIGNFQSPASCMNLLVIYPNQLDPPTYPNYNFNHGDSIPAWIPENVELPAKYTIRFTCNPFQSDAIVEVLPKNGPDLAITEVFATSSSNPEDGHLTRLYYGAEYTVHALVKNVGSERVSGIQNIANEIWMENGKIGRRSLCYDEITSTLQPNQSYYISCTFTVPFFSGNSLTLSGIADKEDVLAEKDETNNSASSKVNVDFTPESCQAVGTFCGFELVGSYPPNNIYLCETSGDDPTYDLTCPNGCKQKGNQAECALTAPTPMPTPGPSGPCQFDGTFCGSELVGSYPPNNIYLCETSGDDPTYDLTCPGGCKQKGNQAECLPIIPTPRPADTPTPKPTIPLCNHSCPASHPLRKCDPDGDKWCCNNFGTCQGLM